MFIKDSSRGDIAKSVETISVLGAAAGLKNDTP